MNKANRITPYILPIITIIIVSIVLITKPKGITGFAVSELQEQENKVIRISSTTIIPEGSIVEIVGEDNETLTLSIGEFIQKSGGKPEYQYGEIKDIDYSGKGYIGNYQVEFNTLGLNQEQTYQVYITYNDFIISKSKIS